MPNLNLADRELLSRASKDLQDRFPHLSFFEARWLLIATWHNVTFFGSTDPSLVKDLLNLTYDGVHRVLLMRINVKNL